LSNSPLFCTIPAFTERHSIGAEFGELFLIISWQIP
jgi:hypothetical protein